jgi:hypothetical protein
MTADIAIYEALEAAVDNVYYNKFPQGIAAKRNAWRY